MSITIASPCPCVYFSLIFSFSSLLLDTSWKCCDLANIFQRMSMKTDSDNQGNKKLFACSIPTS